MKPTDVVNLEDRARTAISLGESHFREFKSALHGPPDAKQARKAKGIRRDIGEALVAFANGDGGELLIGVEDDGSITGIDGLSERDKASLRESPDSQVHAKTPLPPVRTTTLNLDGRQVLYFSVLKSTSHVHLTSDGRCVQRRDLETVPIPPEEILLDRRERESRAYDRQYVDGASVGDLRLDLVRSLAEQISPGMSVEKCLQYLDLAEYVGPGLRLRRAALLLFATAPQNWHPRLQVRIIKVDGTEMRTGAQYNVKSDHVVTASVLELIEKAWQALRPLLVQTRLGKDARFGSTIMYPEFACREALINAIAHRDYSDEGRGVEIYVFDDRMEVRNPGPLLSSLKVDDLVRLDGAHQSRNAIVARVLREFGYMRELGEGMRRMFQLMQASELRPPVLASGSDSFSITLRHATIYSPEQQLWLDQFATSILSREQKSIIVLGMAGRVISPQEIWDSLGIVDTEHYRKLVHSLQELHILESVVPKPLAQRMARQRRVGVRTIARFKISAPQDGAEKPGTTQRRRRAKRGNLELNAPDLEARVWIGNLSYSIDKGELVSFLSTFGEVQTVNIPRNRNTGWGKGYAFVEFATVEDAAKVRTQLDGQVFQGRRIVARKSEPRGA